MPTGLCLFFIRRDYRDYFFKSPFKLLSAFNSANLPSGFNPLRRVQPDENVRAVSTALRFRASVKIMNPRLPGLPTMVGLMLVALGATWLSLAGTPEPEGVAAIVSCLHSANWRRHGVQRSYGKGRF
jgi:hypothetical protein